MPESRSPRDASELTVDYRAHQSFDLKKDRKLNLAVQGVFLLVVVVALGASLFLRLPIQTNWTPLFTVVVTLGACLLYMALHEATHGGALWALTRVKPSFALRIPFLTTGNHAYLSRGKAVIVALWPVVIWGFVLVVALAVLPEDFRMTAYVLLTLNFAGSAGDFVEVCLVSRQPRNALIRDNGNTLNVFVPGAEQSLSPIASTRTGH
ncbi:DUF3267 domain-containing protein [Cryobacterium roopkundense]|uniref:DUF3267 domain-containing protein n=1 Tax=Cryobacterium roopkundense TaxID=1001240 RepID=A0A7W9A0V3_9MICO|nr:DUF3267 domain-containing protein [Cryobacterium roopkundense]MBB5643592.1 hypothetical protein [Cryobacterium roopkundense]